MSRVRTSSQLASELGRRAQQLKALANDELRAEEARPIDRRPLRDLHDLCSRALTRLDDDQFADAYAQTTTYGLLAARWLSRERVELRFSRAHIDRLLPPTSPFIRDLFQRFLVASAAPRLSRLLDDTTALLAECDLGAVFHGVEDPSIHFYQDFLADYDPRLRRRLGVYSTPDELAAFIVRSVDAALRERFGLELGLADATAWSAYARRSGVALPEGLTGDEPFVQILDPAAGTGTFLVRVIEVVHETMMTVYRARGLDEAGAAAAWATYVRAALLPRLHGFELALAPCVVSHLRLGLALQQTGFRFGAQDHLRVYVTDALAEPAPGAPTCPKDPLEEEARELARVKVDAPISVVIGNPPYERVPADPGELGTGGWIRAGWQGWRDGRPLLEDYLGPAREAGAGSHLKNLYNLHVYFWRWATWRVFERSPAPGVVSLVTAASFLRGPGFQGMREALRRACAEVYVLDLEGDQRGARTSDNVFGITIPVCVTTLIAPATPDPARAAETRYARVEGSRADKLRACARWAAGEVIPWRSAPSSLRAPMVACGAPRYRRWPRVTDLLPWQHSGAQFKRTWPIECEPATLAARWRALTTSPACERAALFRESRDRTIDRSYPPLGSAAARPPALARLDAAAPTPTIARIGFRSFDRRWCLADTRVGDFLRPTLWEVASTRQVYLTSLLAGVLGDGPAATVSAWVPDLHHFRGSFGGKDVIPLWRDHAGVAANVSLESMRRLRQRLGPLPPEAVFLYTYAILANPGYTARFADELQTPGPRLPITRDRARFDRGVALGRELVVWHTFGARGLRADEAWEPSGRARVLRPIPSDEARAPTTCAYEPTRQLLRVGEGELGPVAPEVWGFSVSGLHVVKSWIEHRRRQGAGRSSSPLDAIRPRRWTAAMTRELLELLWVLEWTLAQHPVLDAWLEEVLAGALMDADELPPPTDAERRGPTRAAGRARERE
ncbi:MAG: type ISP restriction/modification enzyme [Nannocystaceae bacterium]